MSNEQKPVSAETADAMHATITGLMRENARLREALNGMMRGQVYRTISGVTAWYEKTIPSDAALDAARVALASGGGK